MKKFFSGNYALDSLQKFAMSLMAMLVLLTFVLANLQAVLWQSSSWLVGTVLPAVVVELTNEERATPLKRNATLDAAATAKAQHMARNQYFAHYAPDGTSPWYWFDQSGYVYAHAGENLAIHFTDSDEVVEAWMNSPTHRENIVNSKFTEIGVGTAKGKFDGTDTVYVVQLFGTPAVVPVVTAPAPAPVVASTPAPTPAPVQAITAPPVVVAVAEQVPVPTPIPVQTTPEVAAAEVASVEARAPRGEAPEQVPQAVTQPATEVIEVDETSTESPILTEASTPVINDAIFVQRALIATSSGLAAATVTDAPADTNQMTFLAIATQPNTVVQFVYTLLAIAVFFLLIISFVDEAKRAHPIQMSYSLALLLLMGGLYWLHAILTEGAIVV